MSFEELLLWSLALYSSVVSTLFLVVVHRFRRLYSQVMGYYARAGATQRKMQKVMALAVEDMMNSEIGVILKTVFPSVYEYLQKNPEVVPALLSILERFAPQIEKFIKQGDTQGIYWR